MKAGAIAAGRLFSGRYGVHAGKNDAILAFQTGLILAESAGKHNRSGSLVGFDSLLSSRAKPGDLNGFP